MSLTSPTHGPLQAQHAPAGQARSKVASAAREFEGVLLQQMLKVLWNTSAAMSGSQGGTYQQMFDGAFADHLAAGGGIGLAPMLEQALAGRANEQIAGDAASLTGTVHRLRANPLGIAPTAAPFGAPAVGEVAELQTAAAQMLRGGGQRWSKDGTLLPEDLSGGLALDAAGSEARARVSNTNGYQGYYKCNVFAFELAQRAGFAVPLQPRGSGVGFPSAGAVTKDASDRSLQDGWARVVSGESPASLDTGLAEGTRALMLAGSGMGEAHGHMAVVERVRSIDYAPTGEIRRIVFDGWEARPDGASHLQQRTWNAYGNPGGTDARNGFGRIEIIELKRSNLVSTAGPHGQPLNAETTTAPHPDDSSSSPGPSQPNSGSEDDV